MLSENWLMVHSISSSGIPLNDSPQANYPANALLQPVQNLMNFIDTLPNGSIPTNIQGGTPIYANLYESFSDLSLMTESLKILSPAAWQWTDILKEVHYGTVPLSQLKTDANSFLSTLCTTINTSFPNGFDSTEFMNGIANCVTQLHTNLNQFYTYYSHYENGWALASAWGDLSFLNSMCSTCYIGGLPIENSVSQMYTQITELVQNLSKSNNNLIPSSIDPNNQYVNAIESAYCEFIQNLSALYPDTNPKWPPAIFTTS